MSVNPAVNDPGILEALYWQEGLSMNEIADRLECSETTVFRRMVQYGIDRRGIGYNSISGTKDTPCYYRHQDAYPIIRHSHRGERESVRIHQLLMVSEGEDPHKVFSDEYACHHINGVKWDNRPENMKLMTVEDHMRYHAYDRHEELISSAKSTDYTRDGMLGWIQAFHDYFGVVPTRKDAVNWPGPTARTYELRFGSWSDAVAEAGYTPRGSVSDGNE